jgi:hypothetical protein
MMFTATLHMIRSTGGPAVKGPTPGIAHFWWGLREWSRGFWDGLFVGEDVNDDPTAHFSSREWADLPVHHPRLPD